MSSMEKKLREDYLKLYCYLATSARGLVEEPKLYGPLRLVDTIERLINLQEKEGRADPFLLSLRDEIAVEKYQVMTSEEDFIAFLDQLALKLTSELDRLLPDD